VGLLLLLAGLEARAAVDCSLAATGVVFGVYDPLASDPDDSSGSVTVTCTHLSGGSEGISYTVGLSTGSSGTYLQRRLSDGPALLNYNLFTNLARTLIWGNGGPGTTVAAGSLRVGPGGGNKTRQTVHPVYGRSPALQDVPSGNYADAIIVTLEF
jgi:spore coat protein U-like protein